MKKEFKQEDHQKLEKKDKQELEQDIQKDDNQKLEKEDNQEIKQNVKQELKQEDQKEDNSAPSKKQSSESTQKETIGILGATPLDLGVTDIKDILPSTILGTTNFKVLGFGSFADFLDLPNFKHNLVLANSGLKLAKFCEQKFGTPYSIGFPVDKLLEIFPNLLSGAHDAKRILIIHEQILAHSLRNAILELYPDREIILGSFFQQNKACTKPGDQKFTSEEQLLTYFDQEKFDLIIADSALQRVNPNISAHWFDLPHFAVSGRLINESAKGVL